MGWLFNFSADRRKGEVDPVQQLRLELEKASSDEEKQAILKRFREEGSAQSKAACDNAKLHLDNVRYYRANNKVDDILRNGGQDNKDGTFSMPDGRIVDAFGQDRGRWD